MMIESQTGLSLDIGWLLLSAAAGVLVGFLYFGGLWFTIMQLERVKNPALLFAGSFLGRSGLALAVFYLVSHGGLDRLAACLLGFFLPRLFFIRRAQPPKKGV